MKIDGLPTGWEVVRIAKPKKGEWFFSPYKNAPSEAQFDFEREQHLILRKLPEPLQLREGAWYERRDGEIVGPCKKSESKYYEMQCGDYVYHSDGTISRNGFQFGCDLIREVPPPKPAIDPGEGWRLLGDDEERQQGDEFLASSGVWLKSAPETARAVGCIYRRRIAPKYRPFANASEFAPHRERWIKPANYDRHERHRIDSYTDIGVFFAHCDECEKFNDLLESYTFEDGTPCGVKE